MKKLLLALLCVPVFAFASDAELRLDKAPDRSRDLPALQQGARTFVTYCLNCHSASFVRYNRLLDLGFTEAQVKDLMTTADKIGEPMTVAMKRNEAKAWFGAAPPDLSVIARARASELGSGADWLYTYLRTFYRDDARPTGWNNLVFANVGMPHVLWELQGEQVPGANGKLALAKPGKLRPEEYDALVANLVGYLSWMGEPMADFRKKLGVVVLIGLAVLFVFAYALKREYWKDIH